MVGGECGEGVMCGGVWFWKLCVEGVVCEGCGMWRVWCVEFVV